MKKLTDYMAEELSAAFEKAGYDPSYGKVGISNRPDLCEYQCNGAMAGAKAYKKAPFMIADEVVGNLADSRVFSMKEMVKPGFINLKVSEEFLADYLREMEKDEKLPSVRELATSLTINPNTIQRAYRELEQEGYVYTIPGRGSFVAGVPEMDGRRKNELLDSFDKTVKELLFLGMSPEELAERIRTASK